jgi:hypothetical protein
MQCGYPAVVHGVGICTLFDEINDHLALGNSIPVVSTWAPVCSVVERFGTSSVTSPDVCALPYDKLGELSVMRGSCEMKRRVAHIHVVTNRSKKVPFRILAGRSDANGPGGETRRFS